MDLNDGNISLLSSDDVINTEKEFVDRLLLKKVEIDEMFAKQSNELNGVVRQKEELNKREETIQYELSGLHGARVVLDQLINENQVETEQKNEEQ
jgi:hypothetical protein